jgi:hypothetical protein
MNVEELNIKIQKKKIWVFILLKDVEQQLHQK